MAEYRGLSEQLLSEMTVLSRQSSPSDNPESTATQQLVEHLVPLIEKLILDKGSTCRLAENKSKNIAGFTQEDLGCYRYYALYGFGRHAKNVSKHELDLMLAKLSNFMKDRCLMVSDTHLDDTPEDAPIRSFYLNFNERPQDEAFVSVATVSSGINDQILKRPAYHELMREDHASWEEALDHALEKLRASMHPTTLADFHLRGLPSAKQNLVCTNGSLIRELRKSTGPMEQVCDMDIQTKSRPKNHKLSKTTLIKAEKGEPITKAKLEDIAKLLKVAPNRLVFENIAPNTKRLKELRNAIACTEEELLGQFGLSTMVFFYLLEEAVVVPADTMRYVHHHYKELLGPQTGKFSDLIDLPGTKALAGQA